MGQQKIQLSSSNQKSSEHNRKINKWQPSYTVHSAQNGLMMAWKTRRATCYHIEHFAPFRTRIDDDLTAPISSYYDVGSEGDNYSSQFFPLSQLLIYVLLTRGVKGSITHTLERFVPSVSIPCFCRILLFRPRIGPTLSVRCGGIKKQRKRRERIVGQRMEYREGRTERGTQK